MRPGPTVRAACSGIVAALLLAGCATATDDELQPRPTPTVTVTGEPVQRLPDRLDLGAGRDGLPDLSEAVVWADGTDLSVDGRPVDLTPLRPETVLVLERGLLLLADDRVWFVAGRRVTGLPLPDAESLALSADGTQVVVRLADRPDPVAWTTAGARVDDDAVGRPRTPGRTVTGPGEYAVSPRDAGAATVTGPTGGVVAVAGVPRDLDVRGWTGPQTFFGTGRLPSTGADETAVLRCDLGGPARCAPVGTVPREAAAGLVVGQHPAG